MYLVHPEIYVLYDAIIKIELCGSLSKDVWRTPKSVVCTRHNKAAEELGRLPEDLPLGRFLQAKFVL